MDREIAACNEIKDPGKTSSGIWKNRCNAGLILSTHFDLKPGLVALEKAIVHACDRINHHSEDT